MKAGIALVGDEPALGEADQRRRAPASRATTSGQGTPCRDRRSPPRALTSATREPTDRSIPPVMMTKVMATATTSIGAAWRSDVQDVARRQERVGGEGEEQRRRRAKKTAMERTWALLGRGSRPAREPCGALGVGDRQCCPLADDETDQILQVGLAARGARRPWCPRTSRRSGRRRGRGPAGGG